MIYIVGNLTILGVLAYKAIQEPAFRGYFLIVSLVVSLALMNLVIWWSSKRG